MRLNTENIRASPSVSRARQNNSRNGKPDQLLIRYHCLPYPRQAGNMGVPQLLGGRYKNAKATVPNFNSAYLKLILAGLTLSTL